MRAGESRPCYRCADAPDLSPYVVAAGPQGVPRAIGEHGGGACAARRRGDPADAARSRGPGADARRSARLFRGGGRFPPRPAAEPLGRRGPGPHPDVSAGVRDRSAGRRPFLFAHPAMWRRAQRAPLPFATDHYRPGRRSPASARWCGHVAKPLCWAWPPLRSPLLLSRAGGDTARTGAQRAAHAAWPARRQGGGARRPDCPGTGRSLLMPGGSTPEGLDHFGARDLRPATVPADRIEGRGPDRGRGGGGDKYHHPWQRGTMPAWRQARRSAADPPARAARPFRNCVLR